MCVCMCVYVCFSFDKFSVLNHFLLMLYAHATILPYKCVVVMYYGLCSINKILEKKLLQGSILRYGE